MAAGAPRRDAPVRSMAYQLASYLRRQAWETVQARACQQCGVPVFWAHRPDEDGGGWHPPLEVDRYCITIVAGIAYNIPTYRRHVCDPAAVTAYAEERARLEALRQQRRAEHQQWWEEAAAQRQDFLLLAQELARRDHSCPKCKAPKGAACWNLTKLRRGEQVPNKLPHKERVQVALAENPHLQPPDFSEGPPAGEEQPPAQ